MSQRPLHLQHDDHDVENEPNALHMACSAANLQRSQYIIQTNPDLLHSVDNDGWNAALHAAIGGNVEILQLLADNEVDVRHKNNNGENILHVASTFSNLEMNRYILQTYPDLLHSVDNCGWNAALHVALQGNVEILQLLAENRVDIEGTTSGGGNILHVACASDNLEMSHYIIQRYPDLLHGVDNDGCNVAFHAAASGNINILQLLADKGVDVMHRNNDGLNILHVARTCSKSKMVRYIIQKYPDLLHSVDTDELYAR